MAAAIHIGIGGWTFAPWRGPFYPPGLPQAKELAYAGSRLTSIEINGTFYGSQKPESFAKWRDEVPAGFVFSVKGPRFATHRKALAESESSISRFLQSGVTELGDKLGPILWQFPPTRQFDPDAMQPFLDLLPRETGGLALRHVIEVRHPSFANPEWPAMLRRHGVAAAIVQSDKHVLHGEITAPFIYARLQYNTEAAPDGYPAAELDLWEARLRRWSNGHPVDDLPAATPADPHPRECFAYFISGEKVRAPTAAMAMLARLAAS